MYGVMESAAEALERIISFVLPIPQPLMAVNFSPAKHRW